MDPLITPTTRTNKHHSFRVLMLFTVFSLAATQSLDDWIGMAERGRTDEVRDHMSSIRKQYPQDPGLIYLSALLEPDGIRAVEQYRELCNEYPRDQYCPRAKLKLGEFYYVSGLYIKSGEWLKQYLRQTPGGADKKRALDLLGRSLTISGNADSVSYYLDLYGEKSAGGSRTVTEAAEIQKAPVVTDDLPPSAAVSGGYGVQVGLFGSLENAGKRLSLLQKSGYDGQIRITVKNGKAMHAVVIGNYRTDAKARKVSRQIKERLGLDSFVVKN